MERMVITKETLKDLTLWYKVFFNDEVDGLGALSLTFRGREEQNIANTSGELKALVVAVLNYGAAAQVYFDYKTDDLMYADLTSEQKAMVAAYHESMVANVVDADSSKVGAFEDNGGFSKKYPNVVFGGAFSITYNLTPSHAVDGEVTFYYWDQAAYERADVPTAENATGTMAMTGSTVYTAEITDIAAKEIDSIVYVAAVYESNGTRYCTGVLAYSLGAYCETKAAATTGIQPLAAATAVYGYYAKNYFT